MKKILIMKTLVCVAAVLWIGWSAGAAPVLPEGPKLSIEELSLRGIEQVRLEVMPVTNDLRRAGVSVQRLRKIFTEEMRASDLIVVDRADVPLARMVVFSASDQTQPGALAVTFVIAFHQNIVLKRVDAHTQAPTAFFAQTKLTTTAKASDVTDWSVRNMTRRVVKIMRRATDHRQGT